MSVTQAGPGGGRREGREPEGRRLQGGCGLRTLLRQHLEGGLLLPRGSPEARGPPAVLVSNRCNWRKRTGLSVSSECLRGTDTLPEPFPCQCYRLGHSSSILQKKTPRHRGSALPGEQTRVGHCASISHLRPVAWRPHSSPQCSTWPTQRISLFI